MRDQKALEKALPLFESAFTFAIRKFAPLVLIGVDIWRCFRYIIVTMCINYLNTLDG